TAWLWGGRELRETGRLHLVGKLMFVGRVLGQAALMNALLVMAFGVGDQPLINAQQPPTPTRTPTPISIGNFVWNDLDEDGRQDPGEPGLPGYTVQLWSGDKATLLGTTTTNSSGLYHLTAPKPGDYRVQVLLQTGDQFSPKDSAADDTTDS